MFFFYIKNVEKRWFPGKICRAVEEENGNYIPWDKLQTFFETYLK